MGEVFLADDLVLRRKVAIKIVHRTALGNSRAEKLLRREAKAAAALDNPFICKVYEVGEDDGRVFVAMEYIQGETLRERMRRGPLPVRDVVSMAREIADGLDEANRKRVIHRDLKPSNIIITPQGHVKIMDFGLAKRLPGEESAEESAGTPDGMVVGTREYMSPEQLRGTPLEPSSDLFAFGLILHEMLSGRHPFKKPAVIDTQFAILNETAPDLARLRPEAPEPLRELARGLLAKAPTHRPRIGEVRERLADISDTPRPEQRERTLSASASVEALVSRRPRIVLALALVLLLLVVALSVWVGLRPEPTMPQARMAALVTWPSDEELAALSPDSKYVSFISNQNGVKDLWFMDLSGGEPRRITTAPGDLTSQTFSEDGTEIAYTLESETQKLFQTISIDGGPPTRSLSLPLDARIRRMIRWVGAEVFMQTEGLELVRLSLVTGQLSVVPALSGQTFRRDEFDVSRDGRTAAFSANNNDGSRSIWTQDLGGEARPATSEGFQDSWPFFWGARGRQSLFFASNRSGQEDLWLMERPGREPRQITFGSNRESIESVSADGSTIIFSEVLEGASIFSFDLQSRVRNQLTAENKRDITPSLAADGLLAFARVSLPSSYPWSLSSILLGSLADGRLGASRILLREGSNPVLSPSGRWLTYVLQQGIPAAPYLNLLNVESGHSREIGEMPTSSRTFMAFPWFFVQRDIHWSSQDVLFLVQGAEEKGSRILRLDPRSGDGPQRVAQLKPGELASSLVSNPDGSRFFFVRSAIGKGGGAVLEVVDGRESQRFSVVAGKLAILGIAGSALLVAEEPRPPDHRVRLRTIDRGSVKVLFDLDALPSTLRFIPGLNSISFSRRDSRDVENLFLKRLDTLTETMITVNGIQGVSFSPVSTASGSSTLVFSQQLRNKDLGIIRMDRP